MRAVTSVDPPGGYGTISVIGREGKASAYADARVAQSASAIATINFRIRPLPANAAPYHQNPPPLVPTKAGMNDIRYPVLAARLVRKFGTPQCQTARSRSADGAERNPGTASTLRFSSRISLRFIRATKERRKRNADRRSVSYPARKRRAGRATERPACADPMPFRCSTNSNPLAYI